MAGGWSDSSSAFWIGLKFGNFVLQATHRLPNSTLPSHLTQQKMKKMNDNMFSEFSVYLTIHHQKNMNED